MLPPYASTGDNLSAEATASALRLSNQVQSTTRKYMNTNWLSSLALFISVALCGALILAAQYFIFMPMLDDAKATNQLSGPATTINLLQPYLPTDKKIQNCKDIADGRSLPSDTTCLIAPDEAFQSYSAVKVWSYTEKNWVNPPGYIEAGQRTVVNPAEYQPGLPAPVILNCPWGCTLGYP